MNIVSALALTGLTLLGLALVAGIIAIHSPRTSWGIVAKTSLALAVASFLTAIWTNLAV